MLKGGHNRHGAGKAVALLATGFVVLAGAVACVFVGVSTGEDQGRALSIAGLCFVGIVLLLWFLGERQPKNRLAEGWSWLSRRRRKKVEYHLTPRPRLGTPDCPPAPPTAETVREVRGGINTWVPSQGRKS